MYFSELLGWAILCMVPICSYIMYRGIAMYDHYLYMQIKEKRRRQQQAQREIEYGMYGILAGADLLCSYWGNRNAVFARAVGNERERILRNVMNRWRERARERQPRPPATAASPSPSPYAPRPRASTTAPSADRGSMNEDLQERSQYLREILSQMNGIQNNDVIPDLESISSESDISEDAQEENTREDTRPHINHIIQS